MLSFSVEAAQDELGLLIKKGRTILHLPRQTMPQVEIVLRTEADWLRESYDTLALVFQKNSQGDALLEMGPRHRRGALSTEIGTYFEERMNNRLGLLDHLRTRISEITTRASTTLG
jgi:hypothetical protein